MNPAALDLQTAADQLGVHYQTAYRWIRSGRLTAEMVSGRYLIEPDDLISFKQSVSKPQGPPPPKAKRLAHAAERMLEDMLVGRVEDESLRRPGKAQAKGQERSQ